MFNKKNFDLDEFMKSKLARFYTRDLNTLKKTGDIIKRPDLATTLDKVASGGADEFYKGSIAQDIISTVSKPITS